MNRISIIDPVGGHGGMEHYDYGLCFGLNSVGLEPHFFTSNKTKAILTDKVVTHFTFGNMWSKPKFLKLIFLIRGYINAFRWSRKHNVRNVHFQFFHLGVQNVFVLFLAKYLFNLKIIVTLHDIESFKGWNSKGLQKMAFRLIDSFIVHNKFSYKELVAKLTQDSKVSVIPHGDYLNFVSSIPYKENKITTFNLLFFGQIKEVKGLDILLKAMHILKIIEPNINLTIAGKPWGTDKAKYNKLIEDYQLQNTVKVFFNYIPNEEISSYFEACDLVVLPYKKIYQSGVLLLTMSYGRVALCSDLDAFREIIEDEVSGYLFKTGDAQSLADKIKKVYNNRQQIVKVKKNADQLLERNFSWEVIAALTKRVYEKN